MDGKVSSNLGFKQTLTKINITGNLLLLRRGTFILLWNQTRTSSFNCRLIDNGQHWTDNWRRRYGLSSSWDISFISSIACNPTLFRCSCTPGRSLSWGPHCPEVWPPELFSLHQNEVINNKPELIAYSEDRNLPFFCFDHITGIRSVFPFV